MKRLLADALGAAQEIINREQTSAAYWSQLRTLLHTCQELFAAEVCALWRVRKGYCELEAYVGYTRPDGSCIPDDGLRQILRYRVTPPELWGKEPFDGITGQVASRGEEFGADSWEEIRRNPNHKGKPDTLIWDPNTRPFRCMFAVPLIMGTKTIGVIKVENKSADAISPSFDGIDKEAMRKLASVCALVLGAKELDRSAQGMPVTTKVSSLPHTRERHRQTEIEFLVKRHDKHDMAGIIARTPDQIDFALSDPDFPAIPSRPFERAVVVGMGGSALPVDVLNDAFEGIFCGPVTIWRRYVRPSDCDDRTLIVASSFSGTTEETLSAIYDLPSGAENVIVLTTGGQLAELANERGYPIIRIPKEREASGFQPRCATGYFVTYLARLLADVGLLKEDPRFMFEKLVRFLRRIDVRRDAERTARWIGDRIPVIYTDDHHERSVARIAKIKFNENAKRTAFFNALPESNHNEMIGFERRFGQFAFLYLRDPDTHPRVDLRFGVMRTLFDEPRFGHIFLDDWEMQGETNLERVFSALTFADWCSYTVALLDGIDPTPVTLVEEFKKHLDERGGVLNAIASPHPC